MESQPSGFSITRSAYDLFGLVVFRFASAAFFTRFFVDSEVDVFGRLASGCGFVLVFVAGDILENERASGETLKSLLIARVF
jgi:hypothetical protein